MRVIDLTIPLYEGMSFGRVYPQERPFEIETISSWDTGLRLDNFSVYCEQGTRLILCSLDAACKDGPKIGDVNIVLRDMVVVDVPKGPSELVTAEEVERAIAKVDFREGDAVLFRTGWGDDKRYSKLGVDYELTCPHFGSDDTLKKIVEIMKAKKSDLFCYDTANCTDMNATFKDWVSQKPLPPTWPSPQAKERMAKRVAERLAVKIPPEGVGLFRLTRAGINLIGGLVNCGEIKQERVKLIALPLKVKEVPVAPCNVVAVEE